MVKVDVVLDLSRGDCGKGKVSHALLSEPGYTHSVRFNGGGNAGHTIYHKGQKFVTHQIPAGVFYGVRSIIGPGCVINPEKLREEIEYLNENGIDVLPYLRIAANAHVVTPEHLALDSKDTLIGTTKTGNGPCYADKYSRKGLRAGEHSFLGHMTVDMHEEFDWDPDAKVLAEGAQGFYLDVDWGDYPYVTSSHCGIGSVLLNGFNHKQIGKVYGVAKAYETYVGAKKFEPNDPVFSKIREIGQEFGATTGRPRQCNWLNLDELIRAAQMNGVDEVLLNKIDVLETAGRWSLYDQGALVVLGNQEEFKAYVTEKVTSLHPCDVKFSNNPYSL
jgi:adenylosuccinate synthase